jgi:hypothetical protein
MDEIYPIYIPSKGRPENTTGQLLTQAELPFTLVVEPQDAPAYLKHWSEGRLMILPRDNQGIAYVRNQIIAQNKHWYWMLDDDLTGFFETRNRRNVRITASIALGLAQQITVGLGATQIALEYQQYAWSARREYVLNGYCDVCVAIDGSKARLFRYRAEANLKEDRDFTLQLLSCGYRTARVSTVSFACPKNGTNKGGLYDQYQAGIEREAVNTMVRLWPGVCFPQTKPDGRYDVKINWKAFSE